MHMVRSNVYDQLRSQIHRQSKLYNGVVYRTAVTQNTLFPVQPGHIDLY